MKGSIPRTVSKLEFRLCQSPGVRATQRGPYCINTDLFAIDRTAGAFVLSKFQFSNGSGYISGLGLSHDISAIGKNNDVPSKTVKIFMFFKFLYLLFPLFPSLPFPPGP